MNLRLVGGGVLVVVGIVFAALAYADEESDRQSYIRSIDDKVKSMSSELDGFSSDSDAGDLDDALSYAREVKDLVSKLESVKGSDSRASDIVSRYPGYIEAFREGARYLKKMKEQQRRGDGIPEKCVSDEADLQTLIRNWVGNPDSAEDAPTKLPEKGRNYRRTWGDQLSKLKEIDSDMTSALSYARFSASDSYGSFGSVSGEFAEAVTEISAYWKRRYEAVGQACSRLALGERHPDIEKALEILSRHSSSAKATVTQLKRDYNEWQRRVRKLREFTIKDRDEIRETMCRTGGEYDMERRVGEVADRWASQISSEYGSILGLGDRLRERARDSRLAKFKGTREVLDGLRANFENLEKLKNYELRGANNPKIRTKIEYGKAKHRDLQSSLCSSGHAELKISSSYCSNAIRPGSNCIADCVVPSSSSCMVIEIKPNSDQAISDGNSQRAAYADGLRRWYAGNKAELFKENPKLAACEDGARFNIESRLEIYDFCPRSSAELSDDPMKEVPSDISESE
jgi:hypothetical protein